MVGSRTELKSPRGWPALAAAALLIQFGALAAAQSLEVRLSDSSGYVNEPLLVQVLIRDFQDAAPLEFPTIEDCLVRTYGAPSEAVQMTVIQGRTSQQRTRTYTYELIPQKPGVLIIPELALEVDGKTLRSPERRVTILPSDAAALVKAMITPNQPRAYVGQRIQLTLSIWIKPAKIESARVKRVLSPERMIEFLYRQRNLLGPFALGVDAETVRTDPKDPNSAYYVYRSTVDFDVIRDGPVTFDNLLVMVDYPTRFGVDMFGDLQVREFRKLRIKPAVENLEIKPLPAEGRPANFTGAVGRFSVRADVAKTELEVGEPVDLRIRIRGEGALETLPPPAIHRQSRLIEQFRVPSEPLAGTMAGGERVFSQTIRAVSPQVTELPPIEYAYFDPVAEEYRVARSAPVPLVVRGTETLRSADIAGDPPPGGEEAAAPVALDGLRTPSLDPAIALIRPRELTVTTLAIGLGAPPVVYGITALTIFARQRRVQPRRPRALRAALNRLAEVGPGDPAAASRLIEAAIVHYAVARLNLDSEGLTGREALAALQARGLSDALSQELLDIQRASEALGYSGAAEHDPQQLAETARNALTRADAEQFS